MGRMGLSLPASSLSPPDAARVTAVVFERPARSGPDVGTMVVTPSGAAAWIAGSTDFDGETELPIQIRALDRRGARLLDQGTDLGFLKLRGSRLSWKNGAETRTATLG
jgi:hypothetical protein